MTDTLRSPVVVPELKDMPSSDAFPRCQDDVLSNADRVCGEPAVALISLAAHSSEFGCRRIAITLCASHRDELRRYVADELPAHCDDCGADVLKVSDIIVAEYPL